MEEDKKEFKLVVMPKEHLENIYQFILSLPAKNVLDVLKNFEQVKLAEENENKAE